MNRPFIVRALIVSTLIFFSGFIILNLLQKRATVSTAITDKDFSTPLNITGLSQSIHDYNGRLLAKIEADGFKVNPRRFYVFNVKSINEVTITNARIELYVYEKEQTPEVDLISLSESILPHSNTGGSSKEFGRITRGMINKMSIEVYKNGKISMSARAGQGVIDFRKRVTKMKDVSIEDASTQKVIKSNAVIWDNKEKVFIIPGDYIAITPKGSAKGNGLKIDLNFNMRRIS
ncbi:MAG: hypothetical protein HZB61_15900 [Nitrospirae bacterium]|nr:hypothetical protein [Nitrospirota bacterium]